MSSPSMFPNWTLSNLWSQYKTYCIEPLSAGMAIIPTFYGFKVTKAQQLGQPVPKMSRSMLKSGVKAAPTIAGIITTQSEMQKIFEKMGRKFTGMNEKPNYSLMFASTVLTATFSIPLLAVLNAQAMGGSPYEALKNLSFKTSSAILWRESTFLIPFIAANSNSAKELLGNNKGMEYLNAFGISVAGSLVGHSWDTRLTLLQNGEEVKSLRHLTHMEKIKYMRFLYKGAPAKAVTVATFTVFYKFLNDLMK